MAEEERERGKEKTRKREITHISLFIKIYLENSSQFSISENQRQQKGAQEVVANFLLSIIQKSLSIYIFGGKQMCPVRPRKAAVELADKS